MPQIDLIEDTFVAAPPGALALRLSRAGWLDRLWTDLVLTIVADRGVAGRRWAVSGPWTGSAEVWLEPFGDGTIVHTYLRVDSGRELSPRACARERHRRAVATKRVMWEIKDAFEAHRAIGEPPLESSSLLRRPTT